ncbi:hypothetical protein ACFOTA_01690 [Chitinophaga sp. GCM10012297]|uniref:Uncharacterized protein n=1 Tax=Chitinophaga chungangae TaxID=2821488 RepID=A0ABS3Y8A5_9BACT|nr:hypothetical protein [Chitinophaga chungangae]MBO9150906.1 hypothetical protein [Chitinophaga chungangae]
MYYLKCGHCPEMSAIKSEYITFCDHCGKKFPLTYADWKAQRPDGTLNVFGQERGISEERYQAIMKKRRRNRFDLRGKAALITGIVVLITCGTLSAFYGPELVKIFRAPKVAPTMLEMNNWRTFRGNILRIQSPLSLSPATVADAPNMRRKTFKGGSYADGLVIRMDETVYLSDAHIELDAAAADATRVMEKTIGVSKFSYKTRELSLNGEKALLQQGSYILRENSPLEFNSLVVVRGGSRVQLLVTHPANDETGRKVAEKIMRSAVMN